ncbi:SufE family protein [Parvularcula sp. LCG005]|uniref:SufE family protein n=1 Tax=Parvularcula sp. LCG005 TaxID=3078805 RepID=UPI0029437780|nr:SufE family protein [Parvularcula sp. LCG005]WOI53981.1 SufE family protein [Parvularcula sp. LCG005]
MTQPAFDDIAADFAFIDDWDERYRYLIDLGGQLAPLSDTERNETNRVRGCASQVWLVIERDGDALVLRGDSDAAIVKGLVGLILSLYSGKTPGEILGIDAEAKLKALDLNDHITPQRANGVVSMIAKIRDTAEAIAN